ncbi:DUF1523 family protein [Aestuariispira insulae]|uniref:Uncharacterized protein DUF1523 n=1 Tax=Aestuariispira insulae TaxID=1461337 RepID=A0A3D9HXF3_9PROT|nr:DUF1523 family protein [Aestuariispira insulae]RED54177.1 uncharacterized protein DUF1523 [Aestuariispira insulae]
MKNSRFFWIGLFVLLFSGLFVAVDFYLPRPELVKITGTDVKRMDRKFNEGAMDRIKGINENDRIDVGKTRDVRFIYAETIDGGTRVYRNEDTGWAFPWYFKFDSGSVASKASALSNRGAGDAQRYAVVRTYGWRIEVLSMFPNVITIRESDHAAFTFPIAKTIAYLLLVGLALLLFRWTARFRRTLSDGVEELAETASDMMDGAGAAMDRAADSFKSATDRQSKPSPKATVDPERFFKK